MLPSRSGSMSSRQSSRRHAAKEDKSSHHQEEERGGGGRARKGRGEAEPPAPPPGSRRPRGSPRGRDTTHDSKAVAATDNGSTSRPSRKRRASAEQEREAPAGKVGVVHGRGSHVIT